MASGWKRVLECALCGKNRCAVSIGNSRKAYCHRFGKTFFLSNDKQGYSVRAAVEKKKKLGNKRQETFDFEDNQDFQNHLDAISE